MGLYLLLIIDIVAALLVAALISAIRREHRLGRSGRYRSIDDRTELNLTHGEKCR